MVRHLTPAGCRPEGRRGFVIVAAMAPDAIDFAGVRRVLVTKLRHHGDVLLASPVFAALKSHAPHAEIDALVYRETAPMLANHPSIAQLHTIDREWKRQGVIAQAAREWRLYSALRGREYDLVVHLTEHPRGAWLRRALGTRYGVAPRRSDASRFWDRAFTHYYALPRGTRRHTVELNLDALRRIGVHPADEAKRLVLVPGAAAEAKADELLAAHGLTRRGFIQIHPGSRWQFKCWPAARVATLVERLQAEGERVVLTGAPDPRERAMLDAIGAALAARPVDLGGQLSLPELAALTARAKAFVGVDSAPMHIAAAKGTPAVALFGPSGEVEWGPWMAVHRIVASERYPCRPCGNDGCGGSKVSDCLTTLPVAKVHAALRELVPLATA
jgi:heptosyltransferase-3